MKIRLQKNEQLSQVFASWCECLLALFLFLFTVIAKCCKKKKKKRKKKKHL